jgi:hypothetical protein
MSRPAGRRALAASLIFSACTAGAVLAPRREPVEACPRAIARPQAPASLPRKALPAVAWRAPTDSNELVWVDPITLEETGRSLDLGSQNVGWLRALSPDGKLIALGGGSSAIRIVDLARNRIDAELRLDNHPAMFLAWPEQGTLVVVTRPSDNSGGGSIVVADPMTGEVLADKELSGTVIEAAASPDLVAALSSPPVAKGARRRSEMSVLETTGEGFTVPLERIESGFRFPPENSKDQFGSMTSPGLAIKPDGSRVVVAGVDGLVADVSVDDSSVTYSRLSGPAPSALTSWLISEAEAKLSDYADIAARWLPNDTVAIYGHSEMIEPAGRNRVDHRLSPSGVTIFNPDEQRACVLAPRADTVLEADGVLLAFREFANGPHHGMGVTAYTLDGREVWHNFGNRAIDRVAVVGKYAYVTHSRDGWVTSVVEVASGEIVSTVRVRPVHLLTAVSNM